MGSFGWLWVVLAGLDGCGSLWVVLAFSCLVPCFSMYLQALSL